MTEQRYYIGASGTRYKLSPDELKHFGVLGMKWGIRRYQNPDGSYKAGAEGRYAQNSTKTVKMKGEKGKVSEDYAKARTKSVKQMSNEELKSSVQRLNDEAIYKRQKENLDAEKPKTLKDKKVTRKESEDSKNAKKHKAKTMSNDELKEALDRLEKEKRYQDLTKELDSPVKKAAKEFASAMFETAVSSFTTSMKTALSDRITGKTERDNRKQETTRQQQEMEYAKKLADIGLGQIKREREKLKDKK